MINVKTKALIDNYIENNPKSKCNVSVYALLEGEMISLDTYKLPVDIVYYNIQNGRFAAEYRETCQSYRKDELNSTEPNDVKLIEQLLYSTNNDILKEDLMRMGQKEAGIITCDGFVINANRRLLCLKNLSKENPRYGYINVGMLPETVSDVDLWKIEANLQLSKNSKLDYGPINTLLKIRDGVAKGLNSEQLSSLLYGYSKKDIDNLLDRLKLHEEYLDYMGHPNMYSKLKGINEHFVDYQNILKKHQNELNKDELIKTRSIVFELINDNISHLKLRQIKNVLGKDQSKSKFLEAYDNTRHGSPMKKVLMNSLNIVVDHAIDRFDAVKKSDIEPVLKRIKNLIVVIEKDNEGLNVDKNKTILLEIKEHIENLLK